MPAIVKMEDFYITLPSNGNTVVHPDNKAHHFQVTLDSDIDLENGRYWEVALAEINYPNAVKVFDNEKEKDHIEITLPHKPPTIEILSDDIEYDGTLPLYRDREYLSGWGAESTIWEKRFPGIFKKPSHSPHPYLDHYSLDWAGTWEAVTIVGKPSRTILFSLERNGGVDRYEFATYFDMNFPDSRFQMPLYWAYNLGFRQLTESVKKNMSDKDWEEMVTIEDKSASIFNEGVEKRGILAHYPYQQWIRTDLTELRVRLINFSCPQRKMVIAPHPNYYKDMATFTNHLNDRVKTQLHMYRIPSGTLHIFHLDEEAGRVTITLPTYWTLQMFGNIHTVLGFSTKVLGNSAMATKAPNLYWDKQHIHIHCNIVRAQAYGNQRLPILRTIPLTISDPPRQICASFETLRYLPVNTNNLRSFEITLCTDTQVPFSFLEDTQTLAVLHFRYKRPT